MAGGAGALRAEIERAMKSAMNTTRGLVSNRLDMELESYYGSGSPTFYAYPATPKGQRTGILAGAGLVDPVSGGGSTLMFQAKLNPGLKWPTGRFSTEQIYEVTNYGGNTLGNHGYWERFLEGIDQDIQAGFGAYFSAG